MNCVDWQERIALHAGGDAAPAEAEIVERHLGECAGCQVFWSGMKESLTVLRESHTEMPDAAHFAAVRARVIGRIESSRRVWRRLAWLSALAAMAILAVAIRPSRTAIPAPPRMLASIPRAPLEVRPVRHPRVAASPPVKREPLTIRLQTSDPNIVIYWIAE